MKKAIKIQIGILTLAMVVSSFTKEQTSVTSEEKQDSTQFTFPSNIKGIIDKSCYMCHNSESKNMKGKMKFNFDKMTNGSYSNGKIASKLRKIDKVVMQKNRCLQKNL